MHGLVLRVRPLLCRNDGTVGFTLQADLAATTDRAEKAEAQLRNATDRGRQLAAEVERLQEEVSELQRTAAREREEAASAAAVALSRSNRAGGLARLLLSTPRTKLEALNHQPAPQFWRTSEDCSQGVAQPSRELRWLVYRCVVHLQLSWSTRWWCCGRSPTSWRWRSLA